MTRLKQGDKKLQNKQKCKRILSTESTNTPFFENKIDDEPLMTKKALAARLSVSEKYLDKLVSAKEIPFIKLGRLVRFRFHEIEKWLLERSHYGN